MRAALLEQENLRLRFEVERLRTEIDRHRIAALNSKIVADAVGGGGTTTPGNAFGANPTTVITSHSTTNL